MSSCPRARCPWLALALTAALAGSGMAACDAAPASSVRARLPEHVAWESAAKLGSWNDSGFVVFNNEWNKAEAGPQTIWADSFDHWGVESTQANSTSVKTYPSVQKDYPGTALRSFTTLTSTFSESMPPAAVSFDAEAAYDIWIDNYRTEVMVWVDNHGQKPAGGIIAHVYIDGQAFAVWQGGPHMFSFVLFGSQETSGRVDLLSPLRWLINRHYLRNSDTMTQVDFGWEIASTAGVPMNFTMKRYSLTTSLTSGTAGAAQP